MTGPDYVCDCVDPDDDHTDYLVVGVDGDVSVCSYCATCAELAEINWTGELVLVVRLADERAA